MGNPDNNDPERPPDGALDDHLHPSYRAAYLVQAGALCPFCESADIVTRSEVESIGDSAWQSISCPHCMAEWIDYYALVDIEVTTPAARADLRDAARWGTDKRPAPPPEQKAAMAKPRQVEEPDFTAGDEALVTAAYWDKTPDAIEFRRRHFVATFKDMSDFRTNWTIKYQGPALVITTVTLIALQKLYPHPLGSYSLDEDVLLVYPE
jgi:hypothetical protein